MNSETHTEAHASLVEQQEITNEILTESAPFWVGYSVPACIGGVIPLIIFTGILAFMLVTDYRSEFTFLLFFLVLISALVSLLGIQGIISAGTREISIKQFDALLRDKRVEPYIKEHIVKWRNSNGGITRKGFDLAFKDLKEELFMLEISRINDEQAAL